MSAYHNEVLRMPRRIETQGYSLVISAKARESRWQGVAHVIDPDGRHVMTVETSENYLTSDDAENVAAEQGELKVLDIAGTRLH